MWWIIINLLPLLSRFRSSKIDYIFSITLLCAWYHLSWWKESCRNIFWNINFTWGQRWRGNKWCKEECFCDKVWINFKSQNVVVGSRHAKRCRRVAWTWFEEVFENLGSLIVEDYLLLLWNKTLQIVKISS